MNTSLRVSAHFSHKGWYSIDWNTVQKYVTKLRQRIYRAEQQKQRRRVTQQNTSKRTPGVERFTASKSNERIKLYQRLLKRNVF
ncbi:reverse transcriptase N-terminal domain-containing protein [Priestia megaterium]|uniref:reverse transcriptase N-terminal domain-containing protein n=1 Tax=Priestia megaterium TaxID=1404 RepID=UPI003D037174